MNELAKENELMQESELENYTLKTKLTVRDCQYHIAKEGLTIIVESNDPMGIAKKTLKAMDKCIP